MFLQIFGTLNQAITFSPAGTNVLRVNNTDTRTLHKIQLKLKKEQTKREICSAPLIKEIL